MRKTTYKQTYSNPVNIYDIVSFIQDKWEIISGEKTLELKGKNQEGKGGKPQGTLKL